MDSLPKIKKLADKERMKEELSLQEEIQLFFDNIDYIDWKDTPGQSIIITKHQFSDDYNLGTKYFERLYLALQEKKDENKIKWLEKELAYAWEIIASARVGGELFRMCADAVIAQQTLDRIDKQKIN